MHATRGPQRAERARETGKTIGDRRDRLAARLERIRLERARPQADLEQQPIEDLPLLEAELAPLDAHGDRIEIGTPARGLGELVLDALGLVIELGPPSAPRDGAPVDLDDILDEHRGR